LKKFEDDIALGFNHLEKNLFLEKTLSDLCTKDVKKYYLIIILQNDNKK